LRQRESEARFLIFGTCGIEFMSEAGSILSGKKASPGRAAVGGGDIALAEPYTLFCNVVDVGCGYLLIPLASQLSISEIICQKNDEVGHLGNSITSMRNKF
jgi:hypothetical protein